MKHKLGIAIIAVWLVTLFIGLTVSCSEELLFNLEDYAFDLQHCPRDTVFAPKDIADEDGAIQAAIIVWEQEMGLGFDYDKMHYTVYNDPVANAWLVCGDLPRKEVNGASGAFAIFDRNTGKSLAAWGVK